ncbi:flagellar basal body-associated FliL family protein [Massilia glaciei]|nr:flagellar basal body-associated FliL family protein [Massilia glaciei]
MPFALAGVFLLMVLGAGAWILFAPTSGTPGQVQNVAPLYVAVDEFVVNLQPEDGDKYLQTKFTLQVADAQQVELVKANMPKVRNRVLLLLSSKKPSEISTPAGKRRLAAEIVSALKQPFTDGGAPQQVSELHYISFIIQ